MPIRSSSAQWDGTLREGKGQMKVGKGAYEGPYSFASRFEEGEGTNPEELIAAAHAGCFSMSLSGALVRAGHPPKTIRTTAKVQLDPAQGGGFEITGVTLETEAEAPGISEADFQKAAEGARVGCPVSKALKALPITLKATLR